MKLIILLLLSFNVFAMDTEEKIKMMEKCSEGEFAPGSNLGKFCEDLFPHEKFAVITLKKMLKDKKTLRENFEKENPDLDSKLDAKAMEFKISIVKKESDSKISLYDSLCNNRKQTVFCLTDKEIAIRKNIAEREACLYRRDYEVYKLDQEHAQKHLREMGGIDWDSSLPSPQNCNTVLANVKKFIKKANPKAVARKVVDESCEWVKDLPRQVITVPGCGNPKTVNICSGFVKCEKGSKKSIKQASCSSDYCSDSNEDAMKCAEEKGFSSKKASKNSNDGVSNRVDKLLNGASKQ